MASYRVSRNWDQLGVSRDRTKSGVPSDRGKERGIAGNFLKYASEHYEWYDKIEKVLIAENMKKLQNAQMSSELKTRSEETGEHQHLDYNIIIETLYYPIIPLTEDILFPKLHR